MLMEKKEPAKKKRAVKTTFARRYRIMDNALEASMDVKGPLYKYAKQHGYGRKKLTEGKHLRDELWRLYEEQHLARETQKAATQKFKEKWKKADETVCYIVQAARLVFKDDPYACQTLHLKGNRLKVMGEWSAQNGHFYSILLDSPDLLEKMNRVNVSREMILEGQKQMKEAQNADALKENAKAESQHATELKKKADIAFSNWMKRYIKLMCVALDVKPQLKELLGVTTPATV